MDEITTIKLRSSNLEGEYSSFEYDFGCYLTPTELADYATLITQIFQYSPDEVREAIQQWNDLKYERFIFKNEQRSERDNFPSHTDLSRNGENEDSNLQPELSVNGGY